MCSCVDMTWYDMSVGMHLRSTCHHDELVLLHPSMAAVVINCNRDEEGSGVLLSFRHCSTWADEVRRSDNYKL
jgi:hypothetical protein